MYDSTARRYVNLEEIARMLRAGADVQVLDARSGKDLTRVILTQIIMEDIRDGEAGLPLKLLRQLAVASDRATHDFLSWYLDTAFELYKRAGSALRSGVAEARSAVLNPVEFVQHLLGGQGPSETEPGELDQLRRQIRQLEARLAHLERRRSLRLRRAPAPNPDARRPR